jgi:hypothetical protein
MQQSGTQMLATEYYVQSQTARIPNANCCMLSEKLVASQYFSAATGNSVFQPDYTHH